MGQGAEELTQGRVVAVSRPSPYFNPHVDPERAGEQRETGNDDPDVAELKSQIAETRTDMSETIDAIQEKLRPANIKHQVGASLKRATVGRSQQMLGTNVVQRVRENPLPAAMVGIGLGWLLTRQVKSARGEESMPRDMYSDAEDGSGVGSGVRRRTEYVRGRAQEGVSDLTGRAQETASQLQDRASQVRGQAQQQVYKARGGFQQMLEESPLALGAVALAVGAAVGLAAPTTPKEHELMGETRDKLLDQAQTKAQDVVQKAQQVAQKAATTAATTAKDEAKNQRLTQS